MQVRIRFKWSLSVLLSSKYHSIQVRKKIKFQRSRTAIRKCFPCLTLIIPVKWWMFKVSIDTWTRFEIIKELWQTWIIDIILISLKLSFWFNFFIFQNHCFNVKIPVFALSSNQAFYRNQFLRFFVNYVIALFPLHSNFHF
jgi:hypothetical protein